MITGAKYQPGDVVCMITDMQHPPCMVIGVTEWVGGAISYTIGIGTERAEIYGEELTAALMDGRHLHADDFGPGEGILGTSSVEDDRDGD